MFFKWVSKETKVRVIFRSGTNTIQYLRIWNPVMSERTYDGSSVSEAQSKMMSAVYDHYKALLHKVEDRLDF